LIALIDDATSRIWARFTEHDSTEENLRTLQGWLQRYGRPLAQYSEIPRNKHLTLFQTIFFLVSPQITETSALQSRLGCWEFADYVATGVVFIGVLGELLTEFTNCFRTKGDKDRETKINKIFMVILLVGLAGELAALVPTSKLTSKITEILRNDIAAALIPRAILSLHSRGGRRHERHNRNGPCPKPNWSVFAGRTGKWISLHLADRDLRFCVPSVDFQQVGVIVFRAKYAIPH
jgi:hypothetical protein